MSAIVLFAAALAAAAPLHLQGTVSDAAGAPVANAVVSIEAGGDSARVSTDAAGRFAVDWAGPKLVMVTVEAPGFPRARRAAYAGDAPVDLVLASATFQDRVTVTAARRPEALGDTAASVLVLSSSDLKTTAGMGLDDALRQVPGFTLFRRTPSRGANPTTQGATFRGLGGSGWKTACP